MPDGEINQATGFATHHHQGLTSRCQIQVGLTIVQWYPGISQSQHIVAIVNAQLASCQLLVCTNARTKINLYAQNFHACESCCLESLLVAAYPLSSRYRIETLCNSHCDERASIKPQYCPLCQRGGFCDEELAQPYRKRRSSATEVKDSSMDPSCCLRNLVLSCSHKLDISSSSAFFLFVGPNL